MIMLHNKHWNQVKRFILLINFCFIIVPSAIHGLAVNDYGPYSLSISWSPPVAPNGIIKVYEIKYRESTSTGSYNVTNTTITQHSIAGLVHNTSYIIGIRAYTSVGPGEWTNITDKTSLGRFCRLTSAI